MPDEIVLIAAVTVDGYIARHKLEITSWSKDLALFKKQTMGFPVIMGSNTYKTLSNELTGREVVVVNRKDVPSDALKKISSKKCFVVGGGKTFQRFAAFLTHLYVTPHPYVFGRGISLFDGELSSEISLEFQNLIEHNKKDGIYQYQYKIIKK